MLQALKYVSFPVQTLAKCAKMIPVMVSLEWLSVVVIIFSPFRFFPLIKLLLFLFFFFFNFIIIIFIIIIIIIIFN